MAKMKLRTDKSYEAMYEDDDAMEMSESSDSESEYEPTPEKSEQEEIFIAGLPKSYLQEAWFFWKSAQNKPRRKFESVKKAFKRLTSVRQLEHYQALIEKEEQEQNAVKMINDVCHDRFLKHYNSGKIVRGKLVQKWALEIRDQMYPNLKFNASKKWLSHWQQEKGVSLRQVSNWVTQKSVKDQDKINMSVDQLVRNVRRQIRLNSLSHSQVFNIDQSGIERECHQGITLAPKGTKKVIMTVQSKNATSHSSTVMPVVGADGHIMPVMFLQIAEPTGHFPKFKPVFQAPNLYTTCGKSHIMTVKTLQEFMEHVYFQPAMPDVSLMICDSWAAFNNHERMQEMVPEGKRLLIEQIPPSATCIAQPLDLYFFRQFKDFVKELSDLLTNLEHESLDIKLSDRDNIIKLMSLTHFQFSAPIFKEMCKMGFYKADFIDDHPEPYQTPLQFCFPQKLPLVCDNVICGWDDGCLKPIIMCAHCCKRLCLKCFFIQFHYCTTLN